MERRSFLKGAAASVALGAMSIGRVTKIGASEPTEAMRIASAPAQLPELWDIIDLWQHSEQLEFDGNRWTGAVRDIANSGHIIGEIVSGQQFRPVVWDETRVMSFLDMRTHADQSALGMVVNSQGLAGGALRTLESLAAEGTQTDFERVSLTWHHRQLIESGGILPADTQAFDLCEQGIFTGVSADAPARWNLTTLEVLDVPDGFAYGRALTTNAAGDSAGMFYRTNAPYHGGVPFIWKADGSVTILELPVDRNQDWAGALAPVLLTEDAQLVTHVTDGGKYFGQIVRFANGMQTTILDAYGDGARLFDSNAGGILLGESSMHGLPIPTVWENDQPIVIADRLAQGPDRLLTNVYAINDHGAIVGRAVDSAGNSYSVLLQPM